MRVFLVAVESGYIHKASEAFQLTPKRRDTALGAAGLGLLPPVSLFCN
jgi:hypothetical protein